MNQHFLTYRQQAIDWWNSTERDFNQGISILETSGFKPGVIRKLKRDGSQGPESMTRLKFLMRELMKAWAMSPDELEDTDTELGIANGEKIPEEQHTPEAEGLRLVDAAAKLETGEEQFPKTVALVIKTYASAYKEREQSHRMLAELPENNTEEIQAQRQELVAKITACSEKMERLYPRFTNYTQNGAIPTEAELEADQNEPDKDKLPDPNEGDKNKPDDYSNLSKEDLQKLRKSVSTKIERAKNMIDYQQESKADKPNPMPECPKRVKYLAKIDNLSKELEQINYAIAALG